MGIKNFIVREGFVVVQTLFTSAKKPYDKVTQAGEVVAMDEEQYAQHAHKLELADDVERAAAAAAEKAAALAKHVATGSVELVHTLVSALQHALAGATGNGGDADESSSSAAQTQV